ncbi:MAG: response regulator, partial [Pseudomonadota bacterium]
MAETTINVLLIEDDPDDVLLIREMLAEGGKGRFSFKVTCADRLAEGIARAEQSGIDIILADMGLPDSQGLETVKALFLRFEALPIIVLTGLTDEQTGIQSLEEGAQDFLVKGEINSRLLVRSIAYALERKQAQDSLRRSESVVHATIDALSAHICALDETGTIIHVNRAWQIFAKDNPPFPSGSQPGDNYLAVCDAASCRNSEDAALFAAGIRAVIKGEQNEFKLEYPCHSSTEKRWFIGRVTSFPGAGPVRIVVAHENITALKMAEAERIMLATAFEQAQEVVKIMNPEGIVQYVNKAAERCSAKTRAEIIGTNIFEHDVSLSQLRQAWGIVSKGETYAGLVTYENLKGKVYWLDFTMAPVYDENGAIICIITIGRDVTHERQLEEQLLQSQKMEAIGSLAGGIAHDFNNILAGMLGYTEILKGEVPQGSQSLYHLDQILVLIDRAVNLIQQILIFSRKTDSMCKPMKLTPLIQEVLKMLRATLPTTIEIRQKLSDQSSIVAADPTHIHQVLMNLCTNAGHALQEKGGILEIELTQVSVNREDIEPGQDIKPGPYVLLKISDTGEGIDPAIIS